MLSYCLLIALVSYGLRAFAAPDADLTKGFRGSRVIHTAGEAATCVSGLVSVPVSATTTRLLLKEPANQTVVTELIQELFQNNSTIAARLNGGTTTIKEMFQIDATLCLPADTNKGQNVKTIQVLTHGIGFDKSYWDIAPGNSYTDAATDAGYATLAYNRLGVGKSDHPDPIQVVQATTDVEILHELVNLARSGILGSTAFKYVIGVGHSYGSIVQLAQNAKYPNDTDAAVLTGFVNAVQNLPYAVLANNPAIAAQDDPSRFGSLPNGYVVHDTPISIQLPFYRFPYFAQSIFDSQYAAKDTYTLGQQFTLPAIYAPAPAFTGPVDVVVGQNDFAFCHGDCNSPPGQAAATISALYPAAGAGSDNYVVPNCGHAINAHYAAPEQFAQITKFLQSHFF